LARQPYFYWPTKKLPSQVSFKLQNFSVSHALRKQKLCQQLLFQRKKFYNVFIVAKNARLFPFNAQRTVVPQPERLHTYVDQQFQRQVTYLFEL